MKIDITPEENTQEKIDRSQVGDALFFHGAFYLEEPFTFWNNRYYNGWESLFYLKKRGGIEYRQRPGERERANKLARWLDNALYFPARAEPLSYEIDEDTTIYHKGILIVDHGELLGPLPKTPWYFYPKRWLARHLLKIVHRVFWFPHGTLTEGFHLVGEPHEVSLISPPEKADQHAAIRIIQGE